MSASRFAANAFLVLAYYGAFTPSQSLAGPGVSGGGNAVVCFDSEDTVHQIHAGGGELTDEYIPLIRSIKTYDLYSAELPHGLNPQDPVLVQIGDHESFRAFFDRIINGRLKPIAPAIGDMISTSEYLFTNEHIVDDAHGLAKIDDVNSVELIDPRCVLATMAAQYHDGDSYYLHLDERLFDSPLHSRESKAVLLLHEYLYRQARDSGQTDSANTRELVGMILRQDYAVPTQDHASGSISSFLSDASNLRFLLNEKQEATSLQSGLAQIFGAYVRLSVSEMLEEAGARSLQNSQFLYYDYPDYAALWTAYDKDRGDSASYLSALGIPQSAYLKNVIDLSGIGLFRPS